MLRKNLKKLLTTSCFLIFCRVIFASALVGRCLVKGEKREVNMEKVRF